MTHAPQSEPGDPEGWLGIFRPLRHYVPSGSRRLLLGGNLAVFAHCGSPCAAPTDASAELPWCPDCRRHLDFLRLLYVRYHSAGEQNHDANSRTAAPHRSNLDRLHDPRHHPQRVTHPAISIARSPKRIPGSHLPAAGRASEDGRTPAQRPTPDLLQRVLDGLNRIGVDPNQRAPVDVADPSPHLSVPTRRRARRQPVSAGPRAAEHRTEEINIYGNYGNLLVSSWTRVPRGCPIKLDLVGDEAQVTFGDTPRGTVSELVIEVDALREFVRLGAHAIEEFDQTCVDEVADDVGSEEPGP